MAEIKIPEGSKNSSGKFDYIEAGDMGREMGKEYLSQLNSMRSSHSNLKGIYYILVYHYQQAHLPTAQFLCLCSMREDDVPNPILGSDLWRVNNDNGRLDLVWVLPHRESWQQLKMDVHTDTFLRECMDKFDEGTLWKKKEKKNK